MRKVFFEFDKFRLTDESRAALRENAAWLREHPNIKVQIEGHCDERGTIDYNLGLSERRAISVRSYLSSLGIEPARIFTISYGEERPVELGHDEGVWAQNRRVEFKIAQYGRPPVARSRRDWARGRSTSPPAHFLLK